ncbi:unnamed protein product [Vitrella brassicaformis CCMP3155]|uniref:Uncharacterized protein n=2 Tax=Vitrella brassicaformis TaxID=1169539 RepID=A0A0G4ENZ9_VITBC|nr:unnamed protein product [Vitrella brassicaformis CCMP3155]|mmetsp:Transcript_28283/g.70658  ORF Transcript_28283/g.70658 Transcript_28283/m.70658 type:complete len:301 (+) Transcript_28283:31-933(+)|eukprot:CEL99176.1 unnamed protein product [Vitrella brassicaformis CCMP3155]
MHPARPAAPAFPPLPPTQALNLRQELEAYAANADINAYNPDHLAQRFRQIYSQFPDALCAELAQAFIAKANPVLRDILFFTVHEILTQQPKMTQQGYPADEAQIKIHTDWCKAVLEQFLMKVGPTVKAMADEQRAMYGSCVDTWMHPLFMVYSERRCGILREQMGLPPPVMMPMDAYGYGGRGGVGSGPDNTLETINRAKDHPMLQALRRLYNSRSSSGVVKEAMGHPLWEEAVKKRDAALEAANPDDLDAALQLFQTAESALTDELKRLHEALIETGVWVDENWDALKDLKRKAGGSMG